MRKRNKLQEIKNPQAYCSEEKMEVLRWYAIWCLITVRYAKICFVLKLYYFCKRYYTLKNFNLPFGIPKCKIFEIICLTKIKILI